MYRFELPAWTSDGQQSVIVIGPVAADRIVDDEIPGAPRSDGPIHRQSRPPLPGLGRPGALSRIVEAVCRAFGVERADLLSDRRDILTVMPRFAAMLLAKKFTPYGSQVIGNFFNRDHTTILHGWKRAEEMLADGRQPFTDQYMFAESLFRDRT